MYEHKVEPELNSKQYVTRPNMLTIFWYITKVQLCNNLDSLQMHQKTSILHLTTRKEYLIALLSRIFFLKAVDIQKSQFVSFSVPNADIHISIYPCRISVTHNSALTWQPFVNIVISWQVECQYFRTKSSNSCSMWKENQQLHAWILTNRIS